LWLPRFFWHYVSQPKEQEENLSLNFWVARVRRLEHFEWLSMRGVAHPHKVLRFWTGAGEAGSEIAGLLLDVEVKSSARMEEDGTLLCALNPWKSEAEAIRWIHCSRMLESAAAVVCGDDEQSDSLSDHASLGGRLLAAMAQGADLTWPEGGRARAFATRLRQECALILREGAQVESAAHFGTPGHSARGADLSADETNSAPGHEMESPVGILLRFMTWDGRLHPGLAPRIVGQVVSSERGDVTPSDYASN
jgi:hypothetical protein